MPNLDVPDALIDIRDHGAKPGGYDCLESITIAHQTAAANNRGVYIPAGEYHLSGPIVSQCYTWRGVGLRSRLIWDGESGGIVLQPPTDNFPVQVSGISFQRSCVYGSTALTLDYSLQSADLGPPLGHTAVGRARVRGLVRNCEFRGRYTSEGWDTAISCIGGLIVTVRDCSVNGKANGTIWGSTAFAPGSSGFRFAGIDDTYGNGHPVQFLVTGCSIYNVDNGVIFEGCEGGFVQASNLVGVNVGVLWVDPSSQAQGFARPQLNVSGSHINAATACILADNCEVSNISGCYFVNWPDSTGPVGTGIILRGDVGCDYALIHGNQFAGTVSPINGVVVQKGARGVISGNIFGKMITTGIWLLPAANHIRMDGNVFHNPSNMPILDQGSSNQVT